MTHPFHPLAGQRVEILYAKRRGGTRVLVCDAGGGRTMTLPVAWTDRGPAAEEHRLGVNGLIELHVLVVLDPDEQVRQAVADVFAECAATGSAYGVVAAFADRRFPRRAYGGVWDGQVRWGRLTHGRALGVLRNPAYAGPYVYGKHRTHRSVSPDGRVNTTCPTVPRDQWTVLIEDHHHGYSTWAQYLQIEAKLVANRLRLAADLPRLWHDPATSVKDSAGHSTGC